MERTKSQKHGELWLKNGYQYRISRKNQDNSESWRCLQRGCRGRLRVFKEGYYMLVTDHCHVPDLSKSEAIKYLNKLKNLAKITDTLPMDLYQMALNDLSVDATSYLPNYNSFTRMVQRIRQKKQKEEIHSDSTDEDAANTIEKTKSQKHKELWLKNGYQYRISRKNQDNSESWRCLQRGCRGRLKVFKDGYCMLVTDHCHVPDLGKSEAIKYLNKLKNLARTTDTPPMDLYQMALNDLTEDATSRLPNYNSFTRMLQRIRQKKNRNRRFILILLMKMLLVSCIAFPVIQHLFDTT